MSEETVTMIVSYAVRVVAVIAVFAVAWMAAGWLGSQVTKRLGKREFDPTLSRFFGKVLRWAVITFAALGCLGVFGIETASFAAVLAAAGLAIGLAFQGTLSNFAAGLMLLVFRPFKVGDVVSVAGQTGKVDEVGLFVTTLDTPDNRRFILPNSQIFGSTIENVTYHATRRVDLDVGVAYGADLEETRRVLAAAALTVEGVLQDPAPAIVLKSLGASSVDWQVRIWCNTEDYFAVLERGTNAVKHALDGAQIGIPYPTMDLNIVTPVPSAALASTVPGPKSVPTA